jgi:hypothetical protein
MHKLELERSLRPVSRTASEKMLEVAFTKLCLAVDSPRSLACLVLFRNKEYHQLVNLEINPLHYTNHQRFSDDYLVTKFLSKYPDFLHEDLDPEGKARDDFFGWERACKETNRKFSELSTYPFLWDPDMHRIFRSAREKIRRLLREPDLDSISRAFAWGPGANSAVKGSKTSAYAKFTAKLDVTNHALVMGRCCVNSTPSWANSILQTDATPSVAVSVLDCNFNIVRGNEIVFVPKNAKTHRVIAIEPSVNSYLQKGFGSEIRSKLRRYAGIDLDDQTINQRLARLGSIYGNVATIDLSGASDTISYELVKWLLPTKWFALLACIRSPHGRLKGTGDWINYEKFSSMGNAFTFELESLIFWSLTLACVEDLKLEPILHVYGDDIAVNSEAYELVAKVLSFAGFSVNEKKSFSSGPFRESCGRDYFLGQDTRPVFLKENLRTPERLMKLANAFRRYSHVRNFCYGCDYRFESLWQYLHGSVPKALKDFYIPNGYGDFGFVSNFDEASPSILPLRDGWFGFRFKTLGKRPFKAPMRDWHGGYTTSLSVAGTSPEVPSLGYHTLRSKTYPVVTRGHTWEWYDFGPWC